MDTSAELLTAVLSGRELRPEDLDELLRKKIGEDLHLDYKRGKWLSKSERNKNLRKWVAGFANAEGGVLLIGVAGGEGEQDDQWKVTGCEGFSDRAKLQEWADNALGDLAPYLRPSPRTDVVKHPNGLVLVVAVDRAPNLVPCKEDSGLVYYLRVPAREDSGLVYYLRNGHQTVKIDSYLHADLVLGRRQRPSLRIEGKGTAHWGEKGDIVIRWDICIENEGLVWARDLRMIALGQFEGSDKVPGSLKHQLALENCEEEALRRSKIPCKDFLEPMDQHSLNFFLPLRSRPSKEEPPKAKSCTWKGALCVLTSNGLPEWAQLEVQFQWSSVLQPEVIHKESKNHAQIKEQRLTHLSSRDRAIISCKWS